MFAIYSSGPEDEDTIPSLPEWPTPTGPWKPKII